MAIFTNDIRIFQRLLAAGNGQLLYMKTFLTIFGLKPNDSAINKEMRFLKVKRTHHMKPDNHEP